jgi:putative flippase GtrA
MELMERDKRKYCDCKGGTDRIFLLRTLFMGREKAVKKEALAYLIVGGLTTLINILVYHFSSKMLGLSTLAANGFAWVISVIFAYFANDRLVFVETKGGGFFAELQKMKRFFGARVFSLLVDEAGMYLLVDVLFVNNMFSKIGMNVIIVVLNYVLSKFFIFKK